MEKFYVLWWGIALWSLYGCAYRKLDKQYRNNTAYMICHVGGYGLFCLAAAVIPFMNYSKGNIPTLLFFLILAPSYLLVGISYILHAWLQFLEGGIPADKIFVYRHQKLTLIVFFICTLSGYFLAYLAL